MQKERFLRWLKQMAERRTQIRYPGADLIAYYWNGTLPTGHPVKDISSSGAYLTTEERWHIDTLLIVTVQHGLETADPRASLTVTCRVVRHGSDGVGVNFMLATKQERKAVHRFLNSIHNGTSALRPRNGTSGQAVVEYALMVPLVFLLIVNAFNFCSFIYCWITVADAVRAAADYACTDGSTADAPPAPSITSITSVIQNATSGLPNYNSSNPAISVCEYSNGTSTNFLTTAACGSAYGNPPADPEAIASGSTVTYATVAVDVTYTFSPFLAGSTFMRFGLPSLPSTIHRRMVVRWP